MCGRTATRRPRAVSTIAALCGESGRRACAPEGLIGFEARAVSVADHVEIGPSGNTFVAYMHARAADVNQERAYVAVVRCDARAYRDVEARGAWQSIEDGEPIDYVWRAGCDKGLALQAPARGAKLGDAPPSMTLAVAPSNAVVAQAQPKATPPPAEPADPRRSDACIRFAETRNTPAGDATITNACAYPIEVSLCYKGGNNGLYDCPAPARGKLGDTLAPFAAADSGPTRACPLVATGRGPITNQRA